MANPRAKKELLFPITSEEQFLSLTSADYKKMAGTNSSIKSSFLISNWCSSFMVWSLWSHETKLQNLVFQFWGSWKENWILHCTIILGCYFLFSAMPLYFQQSWGTKFRSLASPSSSYTVYEIYFIFYILNILS